MKIYSYDIFDTCLIRRCGTPDSLFFLLAQSVYGHDANYDILKNFVHDRFDAERIAKSKKGREVCLNDIYEVLENDFALSNARKILNKELDLELHELSPVAYYVEEIKKVRESGAQIVFISDMYLPSVFLKKVLERNGLWNDGDVLYVSCEHNATKSSGNLFKLVSKEHGFRLNKSWKHTGDNKYSDYYVPKKMGIDAVCTTLTEYNQYEKTYIENSFYTSCKEECALYASLLRACRLCSHGISFHEELSIDIVAATYIPFVVWLLADAKKMGVTHLLFLARDGKIFKDIAEIITTESDNVKLTYLYVSRKSLETISTQPDLFENYLSQLGVTSKDKHAFVDLGWSGSSRTKLCHFFRERYLPLVTTYYWGFWGADDPTYNIPNGGNMKVFNYLFSIQDAKLPHFVIPMLFEHYFSIVNEGTTIGYERRNGMIHPLTANAENSSIGYLETSNRNKSIELAKLLIQYPRLQENIETVYLCCGRRIWARLISFPTRKEIEFFRNIQINEKGQKSRSLVDSLNFFQRLQIIFTDSVFGAAPCWKLASLYNSPLRSVYHWLYNKLRGTLFSFRLNRGMALIYKIIKNKS